MRLTLAIAVLVWLPASIVYAQPRRWGELPH